MFADYHPRHNIAPFACFAIASTALAGAIFIHDMAEAGTRAASYREQARQIRALVNLVIHPEVKTELLELAEQFERLADQAEHKNRT